MTVIADFVCPKNIGQGERRSFRASQTRQIYSVKEAKSDLECQDALIRTKKVCLSVIPAEMHRRGRDGQAANPDDEVGTSTVYSLQDIEKHNSPSDCWLLIHGKVYDVTSWVPRHPGGSMIIVKAGGDCSQLFDSYHPLSTRCIHIPQ